MLNWASFWKPEACGQTVLPDRSVLIGQNLVENANIQKFKCDILSNFQTTLVISCNLGEQKYGVLLYKKCPITHLS